MSPTGRASAMLAALRRHALLAMVLLAYAVTAALRPDIAARAGGRAAGFLAQIGLLLAAAYLFLGLFEEWVSPAFLARAIGDRAGRLRAGGVALLAGTCATGPVLLTYPLASLFARSGATVATIVTFMSAWQIVKLTFLPFEMQFLGTRFALVRFLCTILVPLPSGWLTAVILRALGVRTLGGAPDHRPPDPTA